LAKPVCSVDETAKVFNSGRNQIYAAVRSGQLRSIRISGRILIPTAAIRELLKGETNSAA